MVECPISEYCDRLEEWIETEKARYSKCNEFLSSNLAAYWDYIRLHNTTMGRISSTSNSYENRRRSSVTTNPRGHVNQNPQPNIYIRYRIPSLKVRLVAEVIDIHITLFLKILLVFLMSDVSDFLNFVGSLHEEILNLIPGFRIMSAVNYATNAYMDILESEGTFDVDRFQAEIMRVDQNDPSALADFIGVVIWVVFEIYLIAHPVFDVGPGGCSIGKYVLNLRVLQCSHHVSLPDAVEVASTGDPGYKRAIIRALLKNSGISVWTSLLQVYLTRDPVFSYDILANTIVVQLPAVDPP